MDNLDILLKFVLEKFWPLLRDANFSNFSVIRKDYELFCTFQPSEDYEEKFVWLHFVEEVQDPCITFDFRLGEGSSNYEDAEILYSSIPLQSIISEEKEVFKINPNSFELDLKEIVDFFLKYGSDFLAGNLKNFYKLREQRNIKELPIPIEIEGVLSKEMGEYIEKRNKLLVGYVEKYRNKMTEG